ncbi:STAS domain-containing protein [Streptomyces sp. NBC_00696]|uniref:STAS domain-containing protein n=1 Tax=Streptomyces sp. NBC_00696 TaxID=2903672 RepID=UPI002E37FAB4|nr:STAS domain-containing protein [Streptomyces sp. NBC_00696]
MGITSGHPDSTPHGTNSLPHIPLPGRHARSHLDRGVIVVEFCGVIDLSSIPEIRAHTDALTARHGVRLIVDLRPVDFLDCSTLGLLCRIRRRLLEHEGHMALVCVRSWHLRILRAAGLHTLFEPCATPEDAWNQGR